MTRPSPTHSSSDASVRAARAVRRWLPAAILGLLPWVWFAIRDLSAWLDLIAIGLPLIVVTGTIALIVTAGLRRDPRLLAAGLGWVAFAGAAILMPFRAEPGPGPERPLRIVAANASAHWPAGPAAVRVTRAVAPDVVVVVEASRTVGDLMAETYPHAVRAAGFLDRPDAADDPRDVSVGARFALRPLPAGDLPGVRLRVAAPGRPFILYALHVPKADLMPDGYSVSFAEHRRIIDAVIAAADREPLPVVIAGDLNSPDRAGDYRALRARFRDAVLSEPAGPTSVKASRLWRALFLRIDHILVTPDWCAADGGRIELPGSDHRAVVADIGPCPASPSSATAQRP